HASSRSPPSRAGADAGASDGISAPAEGDVRDMELGKAVEELITLGFAMHGPPKSPSLGAPILFAPACGSEEKLSIVGYPGLTPWASICRAYGAVTLAPLRARSSWSNTTAKMSLTAGSNGHSSGSLGGHPQNLDT